MKLILQFLQKTAVHLYVYVAITSHESFSATITAL